MPLIAWADITLKPNQPTHKIQEPSAKNGMFDGAVPGVFTCTDLALRMPSEVNRDQCNPAANAMNHNRAREVMKSVTKLSF